MLETISAKTASILIAITYLVFIPFFYLDLRSTMTGFGDGNRFLSSSLCTTQNIDPGFTEIDYGCTIITNESYIWIGHVTKFSNVIAVALQGKLKNVTDIYVNGTEIKDDDIFYGVEIKYDFELYTCYKNKGCGLPRHPVDGNVHYNAWQLVLRDTNRKFNFGEVYDVEHNSADIQLIPTTFQNQPALPDNGIVQSYLVFIKYYAEFSDYSTVVNSANYYYKFANVRRVSNIVVKSLLPIFIFLTLLIICIYIKILYRKYKSLHDALPEQRWILYFMIALVLFQNPIYCVAVWQKQPSTGVVYAVYICDAISQAAFFSIWLIFADGLNRLYSYYQFYLPKIIFGLIIFGVNVVIITLTLPTITSTMSRSPVEAVGMWNYDTKITFIVFSVTFFGLLWFWILWWSVSLYSTAKKLIQLPYMTSRYLQLWFRFFTIQATLLTLYYVCQYAIAMNYISDNAPSLDSATAGDVSDSINTLFRQQTLLFGKVIFLTVYAAILAFFFLPAGSLDKDPNAQTLLIATAASYIIKESEIKPIYQQRKKILLENKAVGRITNLNPHIFCVDLALELLDISYQTYYDPENFQTISSFGSLDLEKLDYILPPGYSFHDVKHETICYVFKHKWLPKLVVSFRGTSSKQHWNDNLNFGQYPVDLYNMPLTELDMDDGLNVDHLVDEQQDYLPQQQQQQQQQQQHEDIIPPTSMIEKLSVAENRNSFIITRNISARRIHIETIENDDGDDDHDHLNSNSSDEDNDTNKLNTTAANNRETPNTPTQVQMELAHVLNMAGQSAHIALAVTTDILTTAAASTPILKDSVLTKVHEGFWSAYLPARKFLHELLRKELSTSPAHLYFTGHSLGGALTTFAAYDVAIHTLPRINNYLKKTKKTGMKKVNIGMYSYGAPRVGNHAFARDYNLFVPNSFRIVVDGDIVSAVPASGYKHVGTNIIVDSEGAGSIIIDPSFVEKFLRMKSKVSVGAHSLVVYRTGLLGVKLATEYFNNELDKTISDQNLSKIDVEDISEGGLSLNRVVSTSSNSDINFIRIAHESGQFAARRTSELISSNTISGIKHNEEVQKVDEWAEKMQEPNIFQKFQTLIGWKDVKIITNTESSLHAPVQ